jgi:hypothetical protein
MSVDVKVVTLPVTVRDKHGQIIRNLTKEDFVLDEDGHPQTIRYFTQEAKLPLTLGLLVDTSLSQPNVLDQERTASKSFLDQMLTSDTDQGGGWPGGGGYGGGGRRGGGQRCPQEARPDGKKLETSAWMGRGRGIFEVLLLGTLPPGPPFLYPIPQIQIRLPKRRFLLA